MARARAKTKGRRQQGSFIALPHAILESVEYAALSAHAVKLLLDLFAQYRGDNNGDFSAAWKVMKSRGWTSKAMLYRALRELQNKGWIVTTRQGGKARLGANRICSLYAVTWKPIDPCDGKLDVAFTRVASSTWRRENQKATPPVDRIGLPVGPIKGGQCP